MTELATRRDSDFLQIVGPGKIGFSRAIDVASPKFIRDHNKRNGESKPRMLTHAGIDDAFVEKASVVWYWWQGKWVQLTGAD